MAGQYRLWPVWWVAGAALGCALFLLRLAADDLRGSGHYEWASVVDLAGLALFAVWLRAAWNCAGNVAFRGWTVVARCLLAASLIGMAVLY